MRDSDSDSVSDSEEKKKEEQGEEEEEEEKSLPVVCHRPFPPVVQPAGLYSSASRAAISFLTFWADICS